MKTVAIYTRVSTQEQSQEGYSLGEQESRLRKYADAHGWTVARVYSDPGFSGAKLERPSIQKLIRDVPSRPFDAAIVYKLDRLSRSQKDTLYLIEDVFNANNVGLISMMENFDTQTPFGKAMIGILSVFAQLERDQITERMNMGRIGRAKAGYFSGGSHPPIGYTYTRAVGGDRQTLEIDPYAAEQIRKIFDLFLNGLDGKELTLKGIARYMHAHYKNGYGDWSHVSTVSRVLRERVYVGEVSFSGKWYPGIHEPIIDRETFDAAQRKYEQYLSGPAGTFSENFKGAHLLTGMIRCGVCGDRYFVRTWRKRNRKSKEIGPDSDYNRKYMCYTASGQRKNGKKCDNVAFKMEELDNLIIDKVRELRADPDLVRSAARRTHPVSDQAAAYHLRLEEIEKQEEKLIDLYQVGSIDINLIQKKTDALREERENILRNLEEIAEPEPAVSADDAIRALGSFDSVFESGSLQDKRALLRTLIDEIVIFPDMVEIHWTFSAS